MPKTMEVTVYQYSELSERAKERARYWYRSAMSGDDDLSCTLEDIGNVARMIGIRIDTRPVKLMNGNTRQDDKIHYSIGDRGEFCAFIGRYSYKAGALKAVKTHAPVDTDLHKIVKRLQDIQRPAFYRLEATLTDGWRRDYQAVECDESEDLREALKDFANWALSLLRADWEYQTSDESIEESIECNEYEFDGEGRRV
jgi:hypothetical protein